MMVNELGNTLGGMAVARDRRATRMTLFMYFRNGVKATWLRIVFFKVFRCLVINHFVEL